MKEKKEEYRDVPLVPRFTPMELLVVIAIITILAAILTIFPVLIFRK